MLLALDDIKQLLGIPSSDVGWDASLQNSGEAITRQMEAYCSRGLEYRAGVVEERLRFDDVRLYLRRFPIQAMTSLTVNGAAIDPGELLTSEESIAWGWIERRDGALLCGDLLVTADLGYPPDEVPADLALAFARACGVQSGYGTGNTGSAGSTYPIKTLGLGQGALSIGFDTGGKVASGGSSGVYDVSEVPIALQPMADVLQFYRRFYF